MAINLEHSSSGHGGFHIEPAEMPEIEPPLALAAPAPAAAPTSSSNTWVQALPATPFGPPALTPGDPPVLTLLAHLPAAPLQPPTPPAAASAPSATPAETGHGLTPPAVLPAESDPDALQETNPDAGDRTADFDLMAHHDGFIARSEAAWSAMSQTYMRSLDAAAERDRSGDNNYANERAVEYQEALVRAENERHAAAELEEASPSEGPFEDQSSAETERLARQNGTLVPSSSASPAWPVGPDELAAQTSRLAQSLLVQPGTSAAPGADLDAGSRPSQTVVITGHRPPGTAVDVVLPTGVAADSAITEPGTPTQLLTGHAATAALAGLGVGATTVDSAAIAAGRSVLYLGERVVGYAIPGVGLLLAAATAYDLIHSVTLNAPGDALLAPDGSAQRYAPAADGSLDLQSWVPQTPTSPEEPDGTWVTIGRFVPLSDEERAGHLRPTSTPGAPIPPSPPLVNIPPTHDLRTPGQEVDGQTHPSPPPLVAHTQDWEELLVDVVGVDDPNHGNVPFRSDFEVHLATPDPSKTSAGGLLPSGGHNAYEAMEWLEARGIPYDIRVTGTPGIDAIVVRNPKSPTGESTKTVYDPDHFTDSQMAELARVAGQRVFESQRDAGTLTAGRQPPIVVNGITFQVYINVEQTTNRLIVGNVHPI